MASELEPCPFCSKTMMLRSALWPSEGDADAIIHADPTDCPMLGFSDGSADGSIVEKWNICSSDDEDDFPSDGSCIRCGSVPRNASGLCNTCLDEDAARLENTRPAPAATDTGLVTVMRRYRGTDWPDHYPWAFLNESDCQGEPGPRWTIEKLCLQSQAEEILAAERAEKGGWKELHDAAQVAIKERTEACNNLYKQVNDLKADNAAQAVRIKAFVEYEQEAEGVKELYLGQIEALEAKLAAAEKALESYKSIVKDVCESQRGTKWGKTAECIFDAIERAVMGGKPS